MTPPPTTTGSHPTVHSNRIAWGWWLVAGVGGAVTLAIVVGAVFGALRSGREIDPNTMFGALLTFLATIAALIVPKLNAVGKNTSQTAEHVVNSHSQTNLRDDIDVLKRGIERIAEVQEHQGSDIRGMRAEIGQIRKTERDQWDAIESTAGKLRQRGDRS